MSVERLSSERGGNRMEVETRVRKVGEKVLEGSREQG